MIASDLNIDHVFFDINVLYNVNLTWWPVGQGLFSSGNIKRKNENILTWVYDCGSTKKDGKIIDLFSESISPRITQKQIDVDYLFISHFHVDHINHVEHLIDKTNVKNIMIPENYREVFFIENLLLILKRKLTDLTDLTDSDLTDLTDSYRSFEEKIKDTQVTYIPIRDNKSEAGFEDKEELKGEDIVTKITCKKIAEKRQIMKNGTDVCIFDNNSLDIKMYPYSLVGNKGTYYPILKKFLDKMEKKGILSSEFIKKKYIKCLFSKLRKFSNARIKNRDKNESSLFLLAKISINNDTDNVLYTGDGNLKENSTNVQNFISSHLSEKLNIFQLPHHGSQHNLDISNIEHYLNKETLTIASYEKGNLYKHPHKRTIEEIEKKTIYLPCNNFCGVSYNKSLVSARNVYHDLFNDFFVFHRFHLFHHFSITRYKSNKYLFKYIKKFEK